MRENTIYGIIWRKYTIQNKTEKANSARARTVAFGDWGVGDCGTGARSLRGVTHTHTRETRSSARPRRPPRGVSASAVPRAASGLPGAVLSPPRPSPMHPPRVRPIMRCRARLRTPTRRTHAHAWSMEGRGEAGHQAGGPDAEDGTYERTEIDRSEREATPDATRTGASGHSSCAHRPPHTQSARERAGLSAQTRVKLHRAVR